MIIEDEKPFACVVKTCFRKFMSIACPRRNVPSRITLTRDIVSIFFLRENKAYKTFLNNNVKEFALQLMLGLLNKVVIWPN
jgi:hypothetical protein